MVYKTYNQNILTKVFHFTSDSVVVVLFIPSLAKLNPTLALFVVFIADLVLELAQDRACNFTFIYL